MAKRIIFPKVFKVQVVYEVIGCVKNAAESHRECNLKSQLQYRWIAEFPENAPKVFEPEGHRS